MYKIILFLFGVSIVYGQFNLAFTTVSPQGTVNAVPPKWQPTPNSVIFTAPVASIPGAIYLTTSQAYLNNPNLQKRGVAGVAGVVSGVPVAGASGTSTTTCAVAGSWYCQEDKADPTGPGTCVAVPATSAVPASALIKNPCTSCAGKFSSGVTASC